MDVRALRYFNHVARAGSFSRAAAELHVAQPALSRQIRKIEQELGVELLVRHGRGVRLTSAGSVLLERSEAITYLVQQTSEQVKAGESGMVGHVSLGVPPAAGLLLAPPAMQRFRAEWPHVALHVREGISSSLQEWLLDRRLDVAVLYNPPALETLDRLPVLSERMVLIGPARGKALARKNGPHAVRIRDLVNLPLIMPSLPHNNRRLVEQAAAQYGHSLRIALEVDSVVLTKTMVRGGLGYGVLTHASVQDEVLRGELRAYPIERPPLTSTLVIARLREAPASRLARELIKTLRASLHDLVTAGRWGGGELIAYPASAL